MTEIFIYASPYPEQFSPKTTGYATVVESAQYMTRPRITATIITLNEEKNIARAIESVRWTDEILVVDSGSTDRTLEISKKLGAKVLFNAWEGYGKQKNFAQSQASHDWILNIDADEEVSPELAAEIQNKLEETANGTSSALGFSFPRKTYYLGRWIRHGGWYPNTLVRIANRKHSRWTEPNVHEALIVDGDVERLKSDLHHYTFSSIQDQILTNLRYSRYGSMDLYKGGQRLSLFKLIAKPVGKFIETYFIKKGFLDGLAGFIISINAAHSMFLKHAYLFEVELKNENPRHLQ